MNIIYIVILIYIIIIFGIARFFSRKESLQAYFLNERSSNLRLLTFSNVASLIGAGAVISTIAAIYDSGISYGITVMISFFCGVIIMGIFAKKIVQAGKTFQIYSIVDFFGKRFDKKNQILVFILQFLLLTIRTAVQIIAITYLVHTLTGINYYLALFTSVGAVIGYTALGGLKIDILTDFIQFRIMAIVFIIIALFSYQSIGSLHNLIIQLPIGHLNPLAFGGIGFLIGSMIFGGLIYLANTTHWQRILSAKDEKTAKKSFFRALPLVIFIMTIIIFLGLISSIIVKGIDKNIAIFELIYKILPNKRLIGLGLAAVLSAIMSSLNSLLVAGSTIIYKGFLPLTTFSTKKSLFLARSLTLGFGILCLIITIVLPDIITRTLFCTYLALILAPAIIAGFFFKKISANASFYSILIPTIVLFSLFFIIGKNTFLISTVLAVLIIIFYDKIFRNKSERKFIST